MATLRHEFYESDERLTLSIFDKGADPDKVQVAFEPRKVTYTHGDKSLVLEPLKGQIDPAKSDYTVGKVKVEVRLAKMAFGRWGGITGDAPDPLANSSAPTPTAAVAAARQQRKNWDALTTQILESEKEKSSTEDPNVGGDASVNNFFQQLYGNADEDTKRAMLKSYTESGGTTLSTNWSEVGKGKVEVKPPEGSEWKKWGV
ncbi:SGS-domain-containing protein [Punctularia strigosozonata HHB-11173 SS5]|uniref:SGS-domain-containing protein n=1 Tax=Punctularia strigosozonata (strain HHB-11173) TaxID=741275 RepID=UPI0004417304|nr:SGS-domain-containing protein [Punctularia strigosozonata HHB-11173 SS5]EIN13778.1 SGS-domain-containing protein [Punctularia strigosozonata HHB-11173 SS5]